MAAWKYLIFISCLLASTFCDCCPNVTSLEVDSSFCDSLSNGFYEYPYNCSAYISCNDFCADLEYCPDGKLFNSPLRICDTPEDVECTPLPYPVNPCRGETNNTLLPSAASCDEFIMCINGESTELRCPGELLFNPDLKICDFKDNVWCYGDRTTQDGQGTTPATTEEPFTECVGQKLGAIYPDTGNCQQYYYCWGNDSYSIFPCPVDNWFNPSSGNCGPDISPEACREVVTTTSPLTTLRTTTTTLSDKQNPCEDQELGASFPLQTDCQQYLLCLGGGKSTTAKCPVNSWFDPDTGDCGPNVSPTACLDAFSTSTTTVTTTQSSQDLCANQELGVSYPLETNCQQYILCMGNGQSTVANCIYNGWYDPKTGNCGPDVSPTACKESGIPTESSTSKATTTPSTTPLPTMSTTTAIETTTSPSDILGICSGKSQGYYATYPEECSKYILCALPVPIAFYCPQSLFFNEALQRCVEWESSDCPKEGETTTASPGLTTPAPEASVCYNNSGHNLPYLDNCQWFIRCDDDSSYMMGLCSEGEFFDPQTGECGADVSPDACLETYTTTTTALPDTTESSTTVTTPSTPGPEIDPCGGVRDGKLVPYPNDCTKFIACIQPYPVVLDCVVGQEFSAALERCMAPWYANCSIIITTTTQAPTTTTTESEEKPDSFCFDKSEGTLVPYPNNCSKYIVCQDPIPVGYACPENEEFNPLELICMDAQHAGCNPKEVRLHSPDHGFFRRALKSITSFDF